MSVGAGPYLQELRQARKLSVPEAAKRMTRWREATARGYIQSAEDGEPISSEFVNEAIRALSLTMEEGTRFRLLVHNEYLLRHGFDPRVREEVGHDIETPISIAVAGVVADMGGLISQHVPQAADRRVFLRELVQILDKHIRANFR